jgi:CRP-like cAMP-binding protein
MFHRDWKLDQLKTIDALAHVPKRTLREARSLTTLVHLRAGTVLWKQGDTAQEAFLLLDGELELTWDGAPFETVRPGVVIGGVGLAERAPRLATATTVTDVEALVMSRSEYRQLLRLCPDVAGRVQAGHRARFASRRTSTAVA